MNKTYNFEELAKKSYKRDREKPENFSNWYPCIEDFGKFKTPELISNQILTFEELQIWMNELDKEKVNYDALEKILQPTLSKLDKYKCYFIKNGCFSNKFNFKNCITTRRDLVRNLWEINYSSLLYDTGGETELVVREMIPYDLENTYTIYNGMPLRTELRVFYNMDKKSPIEYVVDYWNFEYCHEHIYGLTDRTIFETFCEQTQTLQNFVYIVDYVHQYIDTLKFSDKLTGIWSIDFMLCKDLDEKYDGVYLIDMARGEKSAYWDETKLRKYS